MFCLFYKNPKIKNMNSMPIGSAIEIRFATYFVSSPFSLANIKVMKLGGSDAPIITAALSSPVNPKKEDSKTPIPKPQAVLRKISKNGNLKYFICG